jgi:hypothetical protein
MHKKFGNELMDYLHILARRHIGQDLLKGCTDLALKLKMALTLAYMGVVYSKGQEVEEVGIARSKYFTRQTR